METDNIPEELDVRINDKYQDPDNSRPPVSERAKEILGHWLIDETHEGVER